MGHAATGFSQSKELGQIHGAWDAIDIFGGKMEMPEKIGFNFDWAVAGQFKSNGGPAISFLELLFDCEEEVMGFFLINVEFAIAGDARGPGSMNIHSWKDLPHEVSDKFGEKYEFAGVTTFAGEWDESGNTTGNLDEGVSGGFLVTGFGIEDDEVNGFIKKLGKGVTGVYGEGSEDRQNVALEQFARPSGLGFVQLLNGSKVDSLLGKDGQEGLVEQLVLVIDHSENAFADKRENFGWTKPIGPVNIATIFYQLLEGGDADFKELI
jgi:hypothetical protein